MKRSSWIIITVSVLGVVGLLSFLYAKYIAPYQPKYDWSTSYYNNSDEPYGTEILYKSLEKSKPEGKFATIKRSFKQFDWKGNNNCYVFIGNSYHINDADADSLINFVEKGNCAFISIDLYSYVLFDRLFPEDFDDEYQSTYLTTYDDTTIYRREQLFKSINNKNIFVQFANEFKQGKKYKFHYKYIKKFEAFDWSYFNKPILDSVFKYEPVSYLEGKHIDCIKIKRGKGYFYLHANPMFFTNYHMITQNGFDYSNRLFSFVGERKIYWDEINKTYKYNHKNDGYKGSYNGEDSPFRYLLSQQSFRWAWYLMLSLVLLFVLFGSKRKQKPIPLIETNKNSSLEYTKAVAAMYYQSGSHKYIVEEMWHLFTVFVKIKYSIDLKTNEQKQLEILATGSKTELAILKQITQLKDYIIEDNGKDKKALQQLEELLTDFYKNTK